MIPLKDHNPSPRVPWLTFGLMVVNVGLYGLSLALGGADALYADYALIPNDIVKGVNYHTLITSMFLHGGLLHLLGNVWFLFIFGDNLENELGRLRYLGLYLASGLAASAAQIASNPDSMIFNIGASGAIAGVMGAYLLLYPKAKVDTLVTLGYFAKRTTLPALFLLAYWLVIQVVSGLMSNPDTGGVAFWAHAGGFLAGLLLVLPLRVNLSKP